MRKAIDWTLPIRTVSEANCSQHWTVKGKRHEQQKRHVFWQFMKEDPQLSLPCHIKLTRYAPRKLDRHDNLPMSFKWILDTLCGHLIPGRAAGRADDDERITVEYDQQIAKKYSIRIEMFCD